MVPLYPASHEQPAATLAPLECDGQSVFALLGLGGPVQHASALEGNNASARAGNRRFESLSALRAHPK
jgi:hypothetical protein